MAELNRRVLAKVRTSFGAAAVVLAVTFVFAAVGVNATTVGFAYLVTIFVIAAAWGLPPAIAASFTATTCFNYFFLPPIHTFSIAEPENWVALGAFLISSLIASQLSDREKRRAVEATSRQAEMEQLYALSRSLMQIDPSTAVGSQIALEVARTCGVSAVAIYNRSTDAVYGAGPGVIENVERRLREVSAQDAVWEEPNALVWAPLRLGDHSLGGIVIQGGTLSKTAVQALTNLVAVSLENVRSREIAARAEAARHSEQFKSTLLDGLAHEFKTPLTSIKAATTALLASKVSDAAQQSELLTIVDQEAERLSRLVTEATHLARVEAGKVQLSKRRCSVNALIRTALEGMEPAGDGRHFEVSVAPDLPDARIDADLMGLALRQLLDNAVKYSPQRSPIRVSAARCGNKIDVHVHNWGEPLPESEQERIFEKFYRGPNVRRHVAGTGMGLAIAREILIAHGGMIRVESTKESGTEFQMEFPYTMQDSPA